MGCLVQEARAEIIAVRGGICPRDRASKALLLLYKGAGADMGWRIHQKLCSDTCRRGAEIKGTFFIRRALKGSRNIDFCSQAKQECRFGSGHEPYLSFLVEQKKKNQLPILYFISLRQGRRAVLLPLACLGALEPVPYVVLPNIASTEAFSISGLGRRTPLPASPCCPPVVCSSLLHQLHHLRAQAFHLYQGSS